MIRKITKMQYAVMCGVLLGSTILTSCGKMSAHNESANTTTTFVSDGNTKSDASGVTTNTSYNAFLYNTHTDLSASVGIYDFGLGVSKQNNNADRRLQTVPYKNSSIILSQEHLEELVKSAEAENIIYKYADMYNVDNAIEHINSYNAQINNQSGLYTDLICDINKMPSESMLVEAITHNNSSYLAANKKYDEVGKDYITEIAKAIIAVLNEYHDSLDEVTLRKVYCMLNDVKVVGIDSSDFTKNDLKKVYNAAVLEDAAVVLDTNQINQLRQSNSLEKTIYHEVVHLFQRQAPAAKIDGFTQIGGSQYVEAFDDTGEINSLHYLWLYEASAEYMSMHMNDSKIPTVYNNMVGYLNTLNLITLLQPEYGADSIAVSQMSNDPDKIYAVLGASDDEEKRELMYMLYSICCISNDREDFTGAYDKEYGSGSFTNNKDTIKNEMRTSIGKTMIKYFYRNLAERIANADVTLEDAFYLINVFEGALSRHLWYDDSSLYSVFEDTMRYNVELQNMLFEYIAQDSGLSCDQVVEEFESFAMIYYVNGVYSRNNSLTWLDEDEKNCIYDMFTNNITDFTVNIRNVIK